MSKHIYEKCFKAISKINKDSFPAMALSYKQYIKKAEPMVIHHDNLNKARSITKAAIAELDAGYKSQKHANKNVVTYLEKLHDFDKNLHKESKKVNEVIGRNQETFLKKSKELVLKNKELLKAVKIGNIPAEELLIEIVKLGKRIQQVTNEDIPSYKKELETLIKKIENNNCDEIRSYHKKTIKLDKETFQNIKHIQWTIIPDELLKPNSKFLTNTGDIKNG